MKRIAKWLAAASIVAALTGCTGNGDVEPFDNMDRGELLDEREDETLNRPGTEYRIEQREDRLENRNGFGTNGWNGNGGGIDGDLNRTRPNGGATRLNGGGL